MIIRTSIATSTINITNIIVYIMIIVFVMIMDAVSDSLISLLFCLIAFFELWSFGDNFLCRYLHLGSIACLMKTMVLPRLEVAHSLVMHLFKMLLVSQLKGLECKTYCHLSRTFINKIHVF